MHLIICRPTLAMSTRSQLIAVLALLAFAAASAYNFQDSYFNELLADELEDWDLHQEMISSATNIRSRREISEDDADEVDKFLKCKHHHGRTCCGKSRWLKHFGDKDKQYVAECFSEFNQRLNATGLSFGGDPFSCFKVNQMKMKIICTTECVGKKSNLIAGEGSLVAEEVRRYSEKLELEEWQRPILQAALDKCIPIANSTSVSTPNTGNIQCNPILLSLQHCLFMEVEKNCPEDQKKTDGKCKRLHDKIKVNSI